MKSPTSSSPSPSPTSWIAFGGRRRVAHGDPAEVATRLKKLSVERPKLGLLVFDATSSEPIEIDLRGSLASVLRRLEPVVPAASGSERAAAAASDAGDARPDEPAGPGRPRLGVVPREVTLLPRHWEWLAAQRGGASATLRTLVEHALRANRDADRVRRARDSAYRFMHAMAGDEPRFEDASRALFAGDLERLAHCMAEWPRDIRAHVVSLAHVPAVA